MAKGKSQSDEVEDGAPELPPGVKLRHTLEGHKRAVYGIAFDPEGGTLASGSEDHTVKLWDATSGKLLRTLEGHQGSVNSVAFDPEGGMLASGSSDRTVKLWDMTRAEEPHRIPMRWAHIADMAFSPDGRRLALASKKNTASGRGPRARSSTSSIFACGM